MFSSMLSNVIRPAASETITALKGSHSMILSPFFTVAPLSKKIFEP